ncbi:hypothetical protein GP486_001540, partial [Trichoglossum hirsutum]
MPVQTNRPSMNRAMVLETRSLPKQCVTRDETRVQSTFVLMKIISEESSTINVTKMLVAEDKTTAQWPQESARHAAMPVHEAPDFIVIDLDPEAP